MRHADLLNACYAKLVMSGGPSGDIFQVDSIPGLDEVRLGVSADGCAVILAPDLTPGAQDQELEHILVSPKVWFDVDRLSTSDGEMVSIVMTKSHDSWLIETFLGLIGILLDAGVSEGRLDNAHSFVQDLVALFRAMSQPGIKEAQGLWGELFLMNESIDVEMSIATWHATPNDRFDFAKGAERMEVKSTTGPRIHRFSHAQLVADRPITATVASLVLDYDAEGICCGDLVELITARCGDGGLKRRLANQVVKTLGEGWRNQASIRFDVDLARRNVSFFSIDQIPRIISSIPPGVLDISYRSDLQIAPALDLRTVDRSLTLLHNFCGMLQERP
jgi:hypothetical protein